MGRHQQNNASAESSEPARAASSEVSSVAPAAGLATNFPPSPAPAELSNAAWDKRVTLTCINGIWSAHFETREGADPITATDMNQRIPRWLQYGYRMYLVTLRTKNAVAKSAASLSKETKELANA